MARVCGSTSVFTSSRLAQYDFCGWDVRRALTLLRESNPTLLDCLRSSHVIADRAGFHSAALALSNTYLSQRTVANQLYAYSLKHYTAYVVGVAPASLVLKKYFYVIHPLLTLRCLRHNPRSLPPLDFTQLVDATPALDPPTRERCLALLRLKLTQTLILSAAAPLLAPLNAWIDAELADAAAFIAGLPAHAGLKVPCEPFDLLLRQAVLSDSART